VNQNCVILNARTLSKRAAREAREAREARAHEKREKLCSRARERAREGGKGVRASGKGRGRTKACNRLPVPAGELFCWWTGGVPTSTPVVRFLLLFTYYFLDKKNYISATRDPRCKIFKFFLKSNFVVS
jgi:hypothetical protein